MYEDFDRRTDLLESAELKGGSGGNDPSPPSEQAVQKKQGEGGRGKEEEEEELPWQGYLMMLRVPAALPSRVSSPSFKPNVKAVSPSPSYLTSSHVT
jgi:hypothetical protein